MLNLCSWNILRASPSVKKTQKNQDIGNVNFSQVDVLAAHCLVPTVQFYLFFKMSEAVSDKQLYHV